MAVIRSPCHRDGLAAIDVARSVNGSKGTQIAYIACFERTEHAGMMQDVPSREDQGHFERQNEVASGQTRRPAYRLAAALSQRQIT